ncbi:MAG: tetratricopeptide repeat protein [Candidatus Binataceae bacterium]
MSNRFVFDDYPEIVYNRYLGNWSFLWKSFARDGWWFVDPAHLPQSSYYRPLLDVWLWIDFHLFGLHPAGWHAAMVALHLLVVWLVYRTASMLAGDEWTGVVAAGLFALMPLHAQAVIWPAAISYPLCAAFELAAFEFYLRACSSPASFAGEGSHREDRSGAGTEGTFISGSAARAGEGAGHRSRWLAISLGFFGGALLTYEGGVTFPFLVAAHAWLLGPDNRTDRSHRPYEDGARRAMTAIWPYAIALAAYFVLRLAVLGFIARPYLENHMSALEVALTLPGTIASYAAMLLIPWLAGPAHRLDTVRSIADAGFYAPVLGLIALCVAAFLIFRNHPRRRFYLFCAAWIIVALGPMLNIGELQDQLAVQDRYLYLASFGFCLFAADLAIRFVRGGETRQKILCAGAVAVAACYAVVLYQVQRYWRDEVTLFSRCVAISPNVGAWHSRLGLALEARGDYRSARDQLERAIALDPYTGGNVFYDLGLIDERLGDPKGAAHMMAEGLKRYRHPPLIAFTDVAIAQDAAGDAAGAEATLKQAEQLPGGMETAALARAQLRFLHGDKAGAERVLRKLFAADPNYVPALNVLGTVLMSENKYGEALATYRRAIALAPNDSSLHYGAALTLNRMGHGAQARAECSRALAAAPGNPKALALMAELNRRGGAN